MAVHVARSAFTARDADQRDAALLLGKPRHSLGSLQVDHVARHLVVFIRPEGRWLKAGTLDHSRTRPVTRPSVAQWVSAR